LCTSTPLLEKPTAKENDPIFLGAAIMMVENPFEERKTCSFTKAMNGLVKYWAPNNKYPLILMNTRPWTLSEMENIRNKWGLTIDIMFEDVTEVFESLPNSHFNMSTLHNVFPLSYMKMCAFFTYGFTQVPLLRDYR